MRAKPQSGFRGLLKTDQSVRRPVPVMLPIDFAQVVPSDTEVPLQRRPVAASCGWPVGRGRLVRS